MKNDTTDPATTRKRHEMPPDFIYVMNKYESRSRVYGNAELGRFVDEMHDVADGRLVRTPLIDRQRAAEDANDVNPFDLAERWADRQRWAPETRDGALGELATMAALRSWLTRWMPMQIHRALMTGSTVAEVCAAVNLSPDELSDAWSQWARVQRQLVIGGRPALSEEDFRHVIGILSADDPAYWISDTRAAGVAGGVR